jgi:NAD(P)-dependent dehydrogenase (short-subunit alcohol dehydrogenase family)
MPATSTDKPHAGRIAVVTGAARGIGQAIAVGLAEQGATVVIGDVGDLTETSELIAKAGLPALAARLDISDPAVVEGVRERVADELGRVDILVNNAAIFESATWDDLDFDLWQRIMAVNLNGPMLMCKAPAAHARPWLGPDHQHGLGHSRHRKPGIHRIPHQQDGSHRVHPCPVGDAGR